MFRSVLFRQLDLPGIHSSLRLRRIRSLEMSAKGKIDSYFSPKPRTGDAKRQRTSNGDNNADRVKRTKESSETGDQTSVNKTPNADKSLSTQSKYNDEKDCTPLSPEQKQSIEAKRMIALEKLQGKSDLVYMGESWKAALAPEFKKDYYLKLKKFVESQRKLKTIYPSEKDVFSWTQLCSVQEVKVVIIGQDPYHGPNQAHGLCFSVPIGVQAPPSLQNIYKELKSDIEGFEIPSHGYLVGWAKQGVLLLNAVLTVEARNANSHQGKFFKHPQHPFSQGQPTAKDVDNYYLPHLGPDISKRGWEHFTDAVIKWINHNSDKVVFLLWGAYAQKKGASIDKKRHCVLKGPHPSPLSAHRGFFGCKHFSKANSYLESNGKSTIDWKDLPKQL